MAKTTEIKVAVRDESDTHAPKTTNKPQSDKNEDKMPAQLLSGKCACRTNGTTNISQVNM